LVRVSFGRCQQLRARATQLPGHRTSSFAL
jgi:hypothetical protein